MILCYKSLKIFKQFDFSFINEIKYEDDIYCISQFDENNCILGGRIIGIFNITDLTLKVVHNDNIPQFSFWYIAGISTSFYYDNFVLTYYNQLICRRIYKKYGACHFGDGEGGIIDDEKALCVFDYNREKKSLNKLFLDKTYRIVNINNNNGKILIENNKSIHLIFDG